MPENEEYKEGYKYPYNSCEILCSENGLNINKLLNVHNYESTSSIESDNININNDEKDNSKNTTEKECVSNGTLNDWCKKAGEMIGVPTLHNHDLRHSGSNILKSMGMELQDIAELLHHESTETTVKHYLQVDKKKIKENKDKFVF
jgi:integrase